MIFDCGAIVVIEYETLGSHGSAFHLLSRSAGNEEEHHLSPVNIVMHSYDTFRDTRQTYTAALQKGRDKLFALANVWKWNRDRVRWNRYALDPQLPRSLRHGNM